MANKMMLETYISSLGVDMPKDWTYFQPGHQFEGNCVFCHLPHDYNGVYKYNPENSYKRSGTSTYCCDECQQAIITNLVRIEYAHFLELPDDAPDENIDDDIAEEDYEGRVSIWTRNKRVALFNTKYEFDASVEVRYGHLSYRRDSYVLEGATNACYFCEINIIESKPFKIKVPVARGDYLNGGIIKCCKSCKSLLNTELTGVDSMSIFNLVSVPCAECSASYLVETEEAAVRHEENLGRFNCPECAYELLDRIKSPGNLLYVKENVMPRITPMTRFKACRCEFCMNIFALDLSNSYLQLSQHEIQEGVICKGCKLLYPKYLVRGTFVYKHSPSVWAIVYSTEGFWAYTIIKVMPAKKIVEHLKTPSSVKISSLAEAVSVAAEECYNLVEGKQLTIWQTE